MRHTTLLSTALAATVLLSGCGDSSGGGEETTSGNNKRTTCEIIGNYGLSESQQQHCASHSDEVVDKLIAHDDHIPAPEIILPESYFDQPLEYVSFLTGYYGRRGSAEYQYWEKDDPVKRAEAAELYAALKKTQYVDYRDGLYYYSGFDRIEVLRVTSHTEGNCYMVEDYTISYNVEDNGDTITEKSRYIGEGMLCPEDEHPYASNGESHLNVF